MTFWKDMSSIERDNLITARYEGKVIEYYSVVTATWCTAHSPTWVDHGSYRVKPEEVVEGKLWKDMTTEEQNNLIVAYRQGEVIEYYSIVSPSWRPVKTPAWFPEVRYRTQKVKNTAWGDLTDVERGALLLAAHEGKSIEYFNLSTKDWRSTLTPSWRHRTCYRVKPEPIVEEVKIFNSRHRDTWDVFKGYNATHKITFNKVNGVIDTKSVKMGEV